MSHRLVPPPADIQLFPEQHRPLAKILYDVVNEDPNRCLFPKLLKPGVAELYQYLLRQVLERDPGDFELEVVGCRRIHGIIGRSPAWEQCMKRARGGLREHGDISLVVGCILEDTDWDVAGTAADPLPPDLRERSDYFYRTVRARGIIPPVSKEYGSYMCRVLVHCMTQEHKYASRLFPWLVKNPPIGFYHRRRGVYRVLAA